MLCRISQRLSCAHFGENGGGMILEFSDKTRELHQRLTAFMDQHIYPNEQKFHEQIAASRWDTHSHRRGAEGQKPVLKDSGTFSCRSLRTARD
jgi:hypothetical protein